MEKKNLFNANMVFLAAIVFNLVVQFAFSLALTIIAANMGLTDITEIPNFSTYNLVAMIFLQGAFFAALAIGRKNNSSIFVFKAKMPGVKQLIFALVCFIACLTCFSWVGEWFTVLLDAIGYNLTNIEINGAVDIILVVLVTVILAPIMEEFLFRNALGGGFYKQKGMLSAVLLSGMSFALMHMNPQQTVYQFLLGCVCAYALFCTQNIVVPIIIHALNNLAAILLSFISIPLLTPPDGSVSVLTVNPLMGAISTVLLTCAGVCAVFFTGKILSKSVKNDFSAETKRTNPPQSAPMPFIMAIIICASMWVINFIGSMVL